MTICCLDSAQQELTYILGTDVDLLSESGGVMLLVSTVKWYCPQTIDRE